MRILGGRGEVGMRVVRLVSDEGYRAAELGGGDEVLVAQLLVPEGGAFLGPSVRGHAMALEEDVVGYWPRPPLVGDVE